MTRRDLTGEEISAEHYGRHVDILKAPFRQVVETGRPVRSVTRAAWREGAFLALRGSDRQVAPDYRHKENRDVDRKADVPKDRA